MSHIILCIIDIPGVERPTRFLLYNSKECLRLSTWQLTGGAIDGKATSVTSSLFHCNSARSALLYPLISERCLTHKWLNSMPPPPKKKRLPISHTKLRISECVKMFIVPLLSWQRTISDLVVPREFFCFPKHSDLRIFLPLNYRTELNSVVPDACIRGRDK